jgi:hypothetical protein
MTRRLNRHFWNKVGFFDRSGWFLRKLLISMLISDNSAFIFANADVHGGLN